jgi:ABC-type transport system involved in multi-copper enzyme maturation permease subunit
MSEQNPAAVAVKPAPRKTWKITQAFSRWWHAVRQNPVVLKEMRSQMRGVRAFVIITVYLVLLSILIGLIYLAFATAEDTSPTTSIRQGVGKAIFGAVVGLELVMVSFLSPALTAGAIAAERERQTYDLLRTTLLPSNSLVFGKLISAVSFLVMLLFVGFPLQSMAFLFGGVSIEEVLIAFFMLLASAVFFSAIGLFVSSFMKSTLASTVISYIVAILVSFGTPVLIAMSAVFLSLAPQIFSNSSTFQETLLEIGILIIGYSFVVVNPLATAIATEVMLVEEQNAFFATIPLSNGWDFPIIGPWIVYIFLCILFSLFLVRLSIVFVRRMEK